MKRRIVCGLMLGMLLSIGTTVGAMTIWDGNLTTENPMFSAPRAYSWLCAGEATNVDLTVYAEKSGYSSKSLSQHWDSGSIFETDWLVGPTYSASGTKFSTTQRGYDCTGKWRDTYAVATY